MDHSARISHEHGLISCLVTHPELVGKAIGVSPVPLTDLFGDLLKKRLAKVILELFNEGESMSTHSILARAQEKKMVRVEDYQEFYSFTSGRSNYESHIWPLVAYNKANRLISVCQDVALGPENGSSIVGWVDSMSDRLLSTVLSVTEQQDDVTSAQRLGELSLEPIHFVPTGFPSLDEGIGGLHPGRVNLIAARPSHGKTAFCLELIYRIASQPNKHVLYFSAEMSERAIAHRIAKRIKATSTAPATADVAGTIASLGLTIDSNPGPTTSDIMGRAVQIASTRRLDLIVFDYLEYSGERDRNPVVRFQKALQGCHMVAKRIGCPFVVVTQMNRSIDMRSDNSNPRLADLEYSGEKIASLVIMLKNEFVQWVQQGQPPEHADEISPYDLDLFVRKNTHGPMAGIRLWFDRENGVIRDAKD